ncbi:MAG: abortive infection system antitoxin AbiGi family protein [Bacteroidota bacterium]
MTLISSNALFHFTDKMENISSILKNGFYPKYSREKVKINKNKGVLDRAIPMVCFCDIPLSQVTIHTKTYGEYGIGLKKEWALKKELNPILYLYENSYFARSINLIRDKVKNSNTDTDDNLGIIKEKVAEILRNIKNYKGKNYKQDCNLSNKSVIFYNEREWRYLPPYKNKEVKFWITKKELDANPKKIEEENEKIIKYPLKFNPSDIRYIIVKNESDISLMIQSIKEIYKSKPKMIEVLLTRIITIKQIREDF